MNVPPELVAWIALALALSLGAVTWRLRSAVLALERKSSPLAERVERVANAAATRAELQALERTWAGRLAGEREQVAATERSHAEAARKREATLHERFEAIEASLQYLHSAAAVKSPAAASDAGAIASPAATRTEWNWPDWLRAPRAESVRQALRASSLPAADVHAWLENLAPPAGDVEGSAAGWLQDASAALIERLRRAGHAPLDAAMAAEQAMEALRPCWPGAAEGLRLRNCYPGMAFDCDWMQLRADDAVPGPTVSACLAFGVDRAPPVATILRRAIVTTR